MNRSKQRGTAAETAVTRWVRVNGFPHADRQPLRGNRDAGDIALAPGIVLEVKSHALAATGQPAPGQLALWMAQAEAERLNAGAAHCPLVVRRAGTTDVGRWWAYLTAGTFASLVGAPEGGLRHPGLPVCLFVAHAVGLLRDGGYGQPIEQDAPPDEPPKPVRRRVVSTDALFDAEVAFRCFIQDHLSEATR